jgi:hypothetical protein
MAPTCRNHQNASVVAAFLVLLVYAGSGLAATVCTQSDFRGPDGPDTRSYHEVTLLHIDNAIVKGDRALQRGEPRQAFYDYDRAMRGFDHPDLRLVVRPRCATAADYRRALAKLQSVGGDLAAKSLAAGKYLASAAERQQLRRGMSEQNMDYVKLMQGWGAFEFYLTSYRYQDFQQHLGPYLDQLYGVKDAADHFSDLLFVLTVEAARLQASKETYETDFTLGRYQNDSIGLLTEEAAGFAALQASRKKVVKALERNIGYWLDQEEQEFAALASAKDMMSEMMTAEVAINNLKIAAEMPPLIKQAGGYKEEPWYSMSADYKRKIQARAEQHGDRLMEAEKAAAAKKYYSFAGARDKRDAASALARKQGDEMARKMKQQVKDGGAMFDAATDEERDKFDSDTDALADELGL